MSKRRDRQRVNPYSMTSIKVCWDFCMPEDEKNEIKKLWNNENGSN